MESIKITATNRDGVGKEAARKVRNNGQIPAVLYGHGVEGSVPLSVEPKSLGKALSSDKGLNGLFTLEREGGANEQVLVRELQRHPVSRKILHIDLVAPNLEEAQLFAIPVNFSGRSIGVQTGGRLRTPYRSVRVLSLPMNVPAQIEIDITSMDHGDAVMASDLDLPEGVTPIYDRDYVVVKVVAPRGKQS